MTQLNTNQPPAKLVFACGSCGASLKVAYSLAGQTLKCPQCHELIRVPRDESLAAAHESLIAPPSWFAPAIIWFVCSSMGFLSGFVYGFWFGGK